MCSDKYLKGVIHVKLPDKRLTPVRMYVSIRSCDSYWVDLLAVFSQVSSLTATGKNEMVIVKRLDYLRVE